MPNCNNCNHQWSFFDTMKIGFTNSRKCPNCGAKQYVSTKSRREAYVVYPLLLVLILFGRSLIDWLGMSQIVFYVVAAVLVCALMLYIPSTIKLSDKQEPLW